MHAFRHMQPDAVASALGEHNRPCTLWIAYQVLGPCQALSDHASTREQLLQRQIGALGSAFTCRCQACCHIACLLYLADPQESQLAKLAAFAPCTD